MSFTICHYAGGARLRRESRHHFAHVAPPNFRGDYFIDGRDIAASREMSARR